MSTTTQVTSAANYITLEARDGDAEELDLNLRMIPLNATGGTDLEVRRPSILRSGNHTFEYVGFGYQVTIQLVYPQYRTEFLQRMRYY